MRRGWPTSWLGTMVSLVSVFLVAGVLSSAVAAPAQALGLPKVLVSITVAPTVASVPAGQTEQFTATGTYSDLSTANLTTSVIWSTSSSSTATISNTAGSQGRATAVTTGAVTVTAADPSALLSGTAALTVLPAVLVSISVAPAVASVAVGQSKQFTATGTYSDLSTMDLTDSVTWSTSDSSTATISNTPGTEGLAVAKANGAVTITAADASALLSGTAALTVLPAVLVATSVTPPVASVPAGTTQQFTATGTYSDLSTKNLTNSVTWSTSDSSTASISSTGLATGVANGAVTITATDPSTLIPGTAALTVLPAALVSISVTPPVASVPAGETEQFTAMGVYSDLSTKDLTNSVTWSTSDSSTATISNAAGAQGLATGVAAGAVTITATDPSTLIPGTAAMTVLPAVLVSIAVTPPLASVPAGTTQQFTATGVYSDLSTKDLTDSVTWSTSDSSTATISSTGLATGVANGAVTVTATDPSTLIPGTAALTVLPGQAVAAVTMTPTSGRRHARVVISGTGFTAGQTVTVSYASGRKRPKVARTVLCTATVAGDETFSCNGVIPRRRRDGALGQKTITASTPEGVTAATTFTLTKKKA